MLYNFFFWENNRFFLSFFGMSESFDFVCVRCINAKWTHVVTIHMHSNSSGCDNFHWLTTLLMPSGYLIFCLFLQTFRKQDQVLDKFPLFLDVKILNLWLFSQINLINLQWISKEKINEYARLLSFTLKSLLKWNIRKILKENSVMIS